MVWAEKIAMAMMTINQETIIAHSTAEMREGATETVADTTGLVMVEIVKKIEAAMEKEKNSASSKDLV